MCTAKITKQENPSSYVSADLLFLSLSARIYILSAIFCYSLLTYSFGRLPFLVNGSCNEVMPLSVALFCKTVYLFWGKSKPPSNPFSHKVCAINSRFLSHTVAYICISQTKNLLRHFSSYHRRVFFIVRFFRSRHISERIPADICRKSYAVFIWSRYPFPYIVFVSIWVNVI